VQFRNRLRILIAASAVVALLATFAGRASAFELRAVDVLGRSVDASRGPTVIFFMSKRCKEASAAFAKAVDERLLDQPVESVGVVDVRRYSGFLRGMCTSYLKRSAEESRVKRRERRQARGVDASQTAVDRWHLIGDFDGSLFERFGVGRDEKLPVAYVVDPKGKLHGPYRQAATVLSAVDRAGDKGPSYGKRRGSSLRAEAR